MEKMTNEKAKECIDAIIGTWEICQNQKYPSAVDVEIDAEDIVALKMAITALSQEDQSEWERDREILKAYADGQESMKPCKDSISREWLKTAIHNFYYGLKHTPTEEDIQAYIDAAPSVSTENTGRGIFVQYGFDPRIGNWHCSQCKNIIVQGVEKKGIHSKVIFKFCPWCGAKMVEPQESEE